MISVTINEFRKAVMYKDNSIEIILNLGEIPDEDLEKLYSMKKKGTCRLLMAKIDEWPDAVQAEAEHLIKLGRP